MGITERKAREKEELRQLIITTATDLFREVGYAGVSMRKIAKRIEYSVGTLYVYYKDKDELFFAVQKAAFRRGLVYIQDLPELEQPIDRLRAMGDRYIRFGLENPDLYRLMFMMDKPMQALEDDRQWEPGIELHNMLAALINDCIAAGQLPDKDPDRTSFSVWSFVHGMVSLYIVDRLHIYENLESTTQLRGMDIEELLFASNRTMIELIQTDR
ncbi:TetR/AcrR family transcriptional regulator [Neolewinella antarctica]|uniref:AcrR family transcriptional regulator n=1 Tax=Neolewinella antarctica TaxID=442734 RepID=A0ABX0X8Q7_9BACT|nr:TetR/AcrR family transcriptional regulator [Neolewinella antarctica]NJC25644.1 AcrR family transcriptional regulator [Neolewinella antarctica]